MGLKDNRKNCSDDPCEALKLLIKNHSKKSRGQCVKEAKQDEMSLPVDAMYLDGQPAKRIENIIVRPPRRIYDPVLPSRGPILDPSMACYEMANACNKRGNVARGPASASCPCKGCTNTCEASGPHCHTNSSNGRAVGCAKDYCNYPDFEPMVMCPPGNAWSGEVYTDCKWPAPCPASCFDHRPPTDWHGQSRRQLG